MTIRIISPLLWKKKQKAPSFLYSVTAGPSEANFQNQQRIVVKGTPLISGWFLLVCGAYLVAARGGTFLNKYGNLQQLYLAFNSTNGESLGVIIRYMLFWCPTDSIVVLGNTHCSAQSVRRLTIYILGAIY